MNNNFPTQSQDQIVGGAYRLGAVLRRSVEGSLYETEFGDEVLPAVIRIRPVESSDRWHDAMELVHPNLIRVYAAGDTVVDDVPVSYAVMERADESLAGVLAERPLSEAETREMLIPAVSALRYLHKNGYAHGNLKSSNILAVGDSLKLTSEDITRVGHGGTPADDMWALGAVLVEALTQERPRMDEAAGPHVLTAASPLFTDIVRRCLYPDPERRWTADQVQARLDAPVAEEMPTPEAMPPAVASAHAENDAPRRTPKWVFAGLALLVLFVVGLRMVRRDAAPNAGTPASAPVEHAALAVPTPTPTDHVNPAAAGKRGTGWAVIAAAYRSSAAAEKRSGEMAKRWSNFRWSVSPEQNGKTYYLVVIGQNLSEDEAEKLRDRAVKSGLPRSTYIKKLQ